MEASTLDIAGLRGPAVGNWPLGRLWSDERLVARIQAGDRHSFSVLYSRYKSLVFAICLGVLGSREDAEDATQEVFTAAARRLDADVAPDNLKAWLARVARNSAIDHLRGRREAVALPEGGEVLDIGSEPHSIVERQSDLRAVMRGLSTLSEQQRSVLLLRELTGYSYDEIAELTGSDVTSVRDNIKRARLGLRTHRQGENMACAGVRDRLAIEADARKRSKELKIHLRSCRGCQEFQLALQTDSRAIRALAPSLALVALWRTQAALAATRSGLIKVKALFLSGGITTKVAITAATVVSVGALTVSTSGERLSSGGNVTGHSALSATTLTTGSASADATTSDSIAASAQREVSSDDSPTAGSTTQAGKSLSFSTTEQNSTQPQTENVTYTPSSSTPVSSLVSDSESTTQQTASTQSESDDTSKTQSSDDSARSEDQAQSGPSPRPVPPSVSPPSPQAQPVQPTQQTQATTDTSTPTPPSSTGTGSTTAAPKKPPAATYLPTFALPTLTVPTIHLPSGGGSTSTTAPRIQLPAQSSNSSGIVAP